MKKMLALLGMTFVIISASAEVFYWTNTTAGVTNLGRQWGDFSDYRNWQVSRTIGDNPSQAIPGENDYIWAGGAYVQGLYYDGNFDLNGGTYTIAGFSGGTGILNTWRRHQIGITNGTLTVTNPSFSADATQAANTYSHEWTIWNGGKVIFPLNASASVTIPNGGLDEEIKVKKGGQMEFRANLCLKMCSATDNFITVDEGGSMIFDPTNTTYKSYGFAINYQNTGGIRIVNNGSLTLPHGINVCGYSEVYTNASTKVVDNVDRTILRQMAGTTLIGGDFWRSGSNKSLPSDVHFELSGGTLEVTNSVKFYSDPTAYAGNVSRGFTDPMVRATMPADATATIDVKVDSSCDLSIMTFGDNAALTKTGPGLLRLFNLPSSLQVNAGVFSVTGIVSSLSGVTFANGTTYCFDQPGSVLAATDLPNAANMRFTVADDFPADGTILSSDDATLLRAVMANFDSPASLAEVEPMIFGNCIRFVPRVDNSFVAYGEVDLNTAANWKQGVPAGGAAILRGESTVGLIKSTTPAFASIKLEYGAKLKVVDEVNLPQISLETNVALVVAEGAWASLSNGLTCACLPTTLPIVEIATNATLVVPGAFDFQNVHLNWYGTLFVDVDNTLGSKQKYIGLGTSYVSSRTTYFGMTCIGGTLHHYSTGDWLERIMYAENGALVQAVGTLLLKDFTHDTGAYDNGQWVGYNNSVKLPFELVVDNSTIDAARAQNFGGAARIRLVNGGEICRRAHSTHPGGSIGLYFKDDVQIICESDGGIVFPRSKDSINFLPTTANSPMLTLGAGGIMDAHAYGYNGNALLVVSNGIWCVDALPEIPGNKSPYPPDGNPRNWVTNALSGFSTCQIKPGTDFYFASTDRMGLTIQQDRYMTIADVPMTGEGGGLVISNGVPGYAFAVTVQCGSNTATGRARALPADDPTTLYFTDGANWAGTVEGSANVALTNLTSAASPAEVNFAGLELTGTFAIRYWRDAEGTIVNDAINLDSALTKVGTGCLKPQAMSNKLQPDEVLWLGDYPSAAGTPDNSLLYRGWEFVTRASATDGKVELGLKYVPVATRVILN